MDTRRLNTAGVMASGILSVPPPKTDIPEDRKEHNCDIDDLNEKDLLKALRAGKLLYLPEYYGVVAAWSDKSGHHGRLLQYRSVTENPDFKTAAELVEWFIEKGRSVAG